MNTTDKCDICDTEPTDTTPQWNATLGWHGVCHHCRLVPAMIEMGKLTFIRIGD